MMSSIIRKDGEGDEIGCVIIETKVDEKKRNLILIFGIRYNEDLIQIDGKDGKSLYTMLNPERIKKAFQKVEEILSEELRVGA